jgi:hypothetical protein
MFPRIPKKRRAKSQSEKIPSMVYWGRFESSPAAFGGGVERYGMRRVMRMGLMELGLPAAIAFPFVLFLIPLIQTLVKFYWDQQMLAWQRQVYQTEQKRRANELRETYRGMIPE